MTQDAFQLAWHELMPFQQQAASWGDSPLLVLAGAGSGKTRVLTCRIARLLRETPSEKFRILALTFTNKAADEMRTRIEAFVPGQIDRCFIGTIHSFCAEILRQHGEHIGIKPNFSIYPDDRDLEKVLNDAIELAKKEHDVFSDGDKKLLPVIQRLKTSLILPEEKLRFPYKDSGFIDRVSIAYKFYEKRLEALNALDFNSLILKTYKLFTLFPAFLRMFQTVYKYVSVDEFQDTNHSHYCLLKALFGLPFKNVFVVADDDQILYSWHGAGQQRLHEYINDYSAEIIQLPENFRCPPEVIEVANNLIRNNFARIPNKIPLKPVRQKSKENPISLYEYPNFSAEEVEGIAADILKRHKDDLGNVAVLARNRRQLEFVKSVFECQKIPFHFPQKQNEFRSHPLELLNSLLKLFVSTYDTELLEIVCDKIQAVFQIQIDPINLINGTDEKDWGYFQELSVNLNKFENSSVRSFAGLIETNLLLHRDYLGFVESYFSLVSGIENDRLKGTPEGDEWFSLFREEKDIWNSLQREILGSLGKDAILEAFLQELAMRSKEPPPPDNSVQIMTIHIAKGKEFDHVYLIGMVEDEIPSFQSCKKGDKSPEMEEERRSCFVALTRTKKTLTLSYHRCYKGYSKSPSRFLKEMGIFGQKTDEPPF